MEKYNVLDAFEMFMAFMDGYNRETQELNDDVMAVLDKLLNNVEIGDREEVFQCFLEFLSDMFEADEYWELLKKFAK